MSQLHFYHLSALPMSMRMVYTMTLLVLGTGYLFAMLHVHFTHSGLDGNPASVSAKDIRTAYHGSETDSRLVTALKGSMSGMLPEEERAVIFKWVDEGADPAAYDTLIRPIMEARCIDCHDGGDPNLPLLTTQEEVMKLVELDTGKTIQSLVRVSHIHLFGITFIFFIVSSIFAHAYMRPLWLKCVIIMMPFLAILTDIFSWYLTKWVPDFAWFIIASGVLMAISFTIQWVVSMWQMWFYTLPDDIQERGGALPTIRRKINTDDV